MTTITLSDYITIQDGVTRVDGTPNALEVAFDLPDDFVQGTRNAKPVVQFKYRARQETDLEMWVNPDNTGTNRQINVTLPAENARRSFHEFVNGNLFVPGAENRLRFILTDHSIFDDQNNDIDLSDILITYQRRVDI